LTPTLLLTAQRDGSIEPNIGFSAAAAGGREAAATVL